MAQQEYLLSALSGIGLSPRQITAAAGTVVTFVHAAAATEAEYEQAERATGESADAWWAARGSFWEDYFDMTRHPTIARLWREGGFDAGDLGRERRGVRVRPPAAAGRHPDGRGAGPIHALGHRLTPRGKAVTTCQVPPAGSPP